jgi:hydroxymethylbilane synthase
MSQKKVYRIGSRDSKLALWQAHYVKWNLEEKGFKTELVLIKSEGDVNLVSPLYEMGVQGIFTKALDSALLAGEIDIAVHSYKDVPTIMPDGLTEAAITERGSWKDVLVYKDDSFNPETSTDVTVATSSLRRRAQWLNRYPAHKTEPLRGNINTRLEKLEGTDHWKGALFAAAGIDRIGLKVPHRMELDWMLPAPAQGALLVVCRDGDMNADKACHELSDIDTAFCTIVERGFLRALMGGCSMPIGALAELEDDKIYFKGNILTADGKEKAEVHMVFELDQVNHAGKIAADKLLASGGERILNQLMAAKN